MKRYDVDTSHFTGSAHNRGDRGIWNMPPLQRLTELPPGSRRVPGFRLRRAMLQIGIPEVCEVCGTDPEWMGCPLTLHVDHINGDFLDNRPQNVRFLCPNCHSQTATYAGTRRDPSAPLEIEYDSEATTSTGIPLGRRLPHKSQ
jgi:hypothetical protein